MKRLVLVVSLLVSTVARAEDNEHIPDLKVSIVNLLVGRINPLGLEDQLRIGLQKLLYRDSAPLYRDNFVFFGLKPAVNPAYLKFGPSLEIQPLSIFTLRVAGELWQAFGSFGILQSFGSPLDNWSDTALTTGQNAGRSYVTSGAHVIIEPTLRLKLGPIAMQNRFSIEYWAMNVHTGDTVFYDQFLDTLVPARGWVISNDLDLLYLTKFRLVVGVRYSAVKPLYQSTDYRPGENVDSNPNGQQRLGPLLAYTFFDHGTTSFNKPTLVLILNWYVDHRFRTGADVSAGIPYAVLGFAFVSDLVIHHASH
jgi:hypothetical protein